MKLNLLSFGITLVIIGMIIAVVKVFTYYVSFELFILGLVFLTLFLATHHTVNEIRRDFKRFE